ncbi:hypothetical protein D3C77_349400 [compost metagenome]
MPIRHQAAGNRCTLNRAGQHLVQHAQVGDHHRIGVGVGAAIVGQWVEVIGIDAIAKADGVGLDPVLIQKRLPGSLLLCVQAAGAGDRRTIGEEVAHILRTIDLAVGDKCLLRCGNRRVVVSRAAGMKPCDIELGIGDREPDRRRGRGVAAEDDDLDLDVAHLVVLVEQGIDRLLGQFQATQPVNP